MKLYILEWIMSDKWDTTTAVIGVYSSREIAELAYESFWNGVNNTAYESNITEVFLDREII